MTSSLFVHLQKKSLHGSSQRLESKMDEKGKLENKLPISFGRRFILSFWMAFLPLLLFCHVTTWWKRSLMEGRRSLSWKKSFNFQTGLRTVNEASRIVIKNSIHIHMNSHDVVDDDMEQMLTSVRFRLVFKLTKASQFPLFNFATFSDTKKYYNFARRSPRHIFTINTSTSVVHVRESIFLHVESELNVEQETAQQSTYDIEKIDFRLVHRCSISGKYRVLASSSSSSLCLWWKIRI